MQVLEFTTNPFKGIIITPDTLPESPDTFAEQLAHSLKIWTSEGFHLAWLEVPIHLSSHIPIGVNKGFTFHHAGPEYLMLTLQMMEGAFIPAYATHYIGAGGVVINDKREILVVSERHRRANTPSYKLPGGALHPGEHLADCVVREILEETGIETEFEALVCFRHWHGYRYGKSDIYFVCRLHPKSHDVTMQLEEIEECLWMPVEDYLDSEFVHTFNRTIVQAALNSKGVVPTPIEGYTNPETHEVFMPPGG